MGNQQEIKVKQSDPRTAENARMGEAASCADGAFRLAGKMGEAASCANWASRLAGQMGEAASCANWYRGGGLAGQKMKWARLQQS